MDKKIPEILNRFSFDSKLGHKILLHSEIKRISAEILSSLPSEKEGCIDDVLRMKKKWENQWKDKPDSYWFARLVQEVGELGSSLVGDHDDPPEWELKQIASIAMNWLDKERTVDNEKVDSIKEEGDGILPEGCPPWKGREITSELEESFDTLAFEGKPKFVSLAIDEYIEAHPLKFAEHSLEGHNNRSLMEDIRDWLKERK